MREGEREGRVRRREGRVWRREGSRAVGIGVIAQKGVREGGLQI